jgi:hypothetical protein
MDCKQARSTSHHAANASNHYARSKKEGSCLGGKRMMLDAPINCVKMHIGAEHTTKQAGNLPDSEVFSRPKFAHAAPRCIHGFGAGIVYPQGRRHNLFCVFKPSSTRYRLNTVASGFQVQQGTEAMPTTPQAPATTTPAPKKKVHALGVSA